MISIRNIKTIILVIIFIATLTSCNACKDSLDMNGPDNCTQNPGSEACQTLCQSSAEYQTWCNITEFCARLSDNPECVKKCAEDSSLTWCNVNPPLTSTCPTDGSFKYTTVSGTDVETPIAMKKLDNNNLISHYGGTVNAVGEDFIWSKGSVLMKTGCSGGSGGMYTKKELNGVIRDLSFIETKDGKRIIAAATDHGPKFLEDGTCEFGEVISLPQFDQTIAIGTARIGEFRSIAAKASIKTAEGLSISLNATSGDEVSEPNVTDYAVFATKHKGIWGIDLSMLKGGCIEYIGETPNNLADIELVGVNVSVDTSSIVVLTGVDQSPKVEEYKLTNMSSTAKRSKSLVGLRAISISGNKLYGLLADTKTVNMVPYAAFDTQNWLTVKDLSSATPQGDILNAKHIAIEGDSVVAAMPMSPECGLLTYNSSGNCHTKNNPGPMEIDSVRGKIVMGLNPLDRNYMAFSFNALPDLIEHLELENLSVQMENATVQSISSHIDHISADKFISASALHSIDDYMVSISPRNPAKLLGWNVLDLKKDFFPDPGYDYRSLGDLKVSEDGKMVMYLLYGLSPDKTKFYISPYASQIAADYQIAELTGETPRQEVSVANEKVKFISPIKRVKYNQNGCDFDVYAGYVLAGKQIFTAKYTKMCLGASYSILPVNEYGNNIVDAANIGNTIYLLTDDGHLKIFNALALSKDITSPPNNPTKITVSGSTGVLSGKCGVEDCLYLLLKQNNEWLVDGFPYVLTFNDAYIDGNLVYAVSRDNGVEVYDLSK